MAVLVCVGSAVMVWVMGNVKLLLEWLTVPLFIIALQLPQGAALYWLVSSLTALAQVLFLFPPFMEMEHSCSVCRVASMVI